MEADAPSVEIRTCAQHVINFADWDRLWGLQSSLNLQPRPRLFSGISYKKRTGARDDHRHRARSPVVAVSIQRPRVAIRGAVAGPELGL